MLPAAAGLCVEGPEGKAIAERRGEIFRTRYLPGVEVFEGSGQLLRAMKERGVRLAVASSADERELVPLLGIVGGDDLVEKRRRATMRRHPSPTPTSSPSRCAGSATHPTRR